MGKTGPRPVFPNVFLTGDYLWFVEIAQTSLQ
jgi:hypothetical protein